MKQFLLSRWADLTGMLVSFGLVVLALVIQTVYKLEPCPLCISQRIVFLGLALAFLLSLILRHRLINLLLGATQVIVALGGAGVAIRHWWIQAHKGQMWVDCGVGFDYMFENFPLKKMLTLIFRGTGDCASIDWTLFGLTLPQFALVAFVSLALFSLLIIRARRHAV